MRWARYVVIELVFFAATSIGTPLRESRSALVASRPLVVTTQYGETSKFDVAALGSCKGCMFEVRVSYVATQPSSFSFRLADEKDDHISGMAFARKLLNTERFVLSTGPNGGVLSLSSHILEQPVLLVHVDAAGVKGSESSSTMHVDYSIIAEELIMGAIPRGAVPFIFISSAAIILLVPTLVAIMIYAVRKECRIAKSRAA